MVENEEEAIYKGLAQSIKEKAKQEKKQGTNYNNQAILEEIKKLI